MAGETLGTIRGQMILDVKQALKAYTQARQEHISTVTALHTGAGAMAQASAGILAAGIGMGAGIMVAVDAAATFEKRLDYFSAVSASTQAEYDAVREKALQLGKDTVYSANEIADSFIELGKAGVTAEQIVGGVGEAVANLGSAADIDLDKAAIILLSAVQTFGLSADEAVGVADRLAGAANASIIEVEDLGVSLKYAGGVARSIGVPFEDLNTAIALLGTYGIRGSTAGTSLRKIMLSLSPATDKAKNAFFELGLAQLDNVKAFKFLESEGFRPASQSLDDLTEAADRFFQSQDGVTKSTASTRAAVNKLFTSTDLLANKFFDAEGSAKPLNEVFQTLQDSMKGLTKEQKVNYLNTIFQNRALASAIALTEEGAAGFDKMAESIDKTTAAEVAGKRLDNLAGDIEILKGNIETLAIEAGSGFQDFARSLVQGATDIIQIFSDLPNWMQQGILGFLAVGAVIFTVVGVAGLFASAILNMIALSMQLKDAMVLLKGAFTAYKTATGLATGAQWSFNAAAAANPVGLVVAIILALVAALILLITYWEEINTFVNNNPWAQWLATALIPPLGIALQWDEFTANITKAMNQLQPVFTATGAFIDTTFSAIGTFLSSFVDGVVSTFNEFISFFPWLWGQVTTFFENFVTGAVFVITQLPGQILAFFQALPGQIGYAIGFILGRIVAVFIAIGTWLTTNVPLIIGNVINFFAELPGQIAAFFTMIFDNVNAWVASMIAWALTNIPIIVNNVIQFFRDLPANVIAFFIQVLANIVAWGNSVKAWIVTNIPLIINNIVNFFRNLPANIIAFFLQMYEGAVKWFKQMFTQAIKIAQDIITNIRNVLGGLPKLVSDIFNNVVNAIKGVITTAANAVRDFAAGMWEGFKDGLGIHSPSYIEHAMWAITDVVDEETKRLAHQVKAVQGLGNGITEMGQNMGFGFGENIDQGLADLYKSVAAARNLEAEFAIGANEAGVGMSPQAASAAALAASLDRLDELPGATYIDKVEVNNPEAEPTSESLPAVIRKVTQD